MRAHRAFVLSLTTLALGSTLTGCDGSTDDPYSPEQVDRAVLVHFQTCEGVLDYAQYQAMEQVGPYGFEGDYGWGEGDVPAGGEDGGLDDNGGQGDPTGGGGESPPDFSGTNVQELGVDEPDIVKTDGNRILALAQGALHYVDVNAEDGPAVVSRLPLLANDDEYYWYDAAQMLVFGDRVLVSVTRGGWDLPENVRASFGFGEEEYHSIVELVEVDVSNAAAPRIVGKLYIEGGYVSGRLHDHTARVVLSSGIDSLAFKYPWDFLDENDISDEEWSGWSEVAYARAEAEAEDYNRHLVRDTELSDWVPSYVHERIDAAGGSTLEQGQLVDCQRMMRPGTYAGLGTLSVLTIDLSESLALGDAVGLFSEGQTVYASTENLYVATRPFMEQTEEAAGLREDDEVRFTSYVHKFELSSDEAAHYVASGEVPGYLLNQWSMSEHEGDLRVASTEWGWSDLSESYVSVLRQDGQRLDTVGQVGGLGQGEQIYAVRFIGDTGYVVTFRQIDPLYTLDLRDPTAPKMVGELKIEGYSAYLHPVGEDLLLGVGRDGTAEGQVTGSQISLFDVSDPANPTVVHQAAFGQWGSSEVEFDHHAFLWWGPENLAVFPVNAWSYDEATGEESYFQGALAYEVDPQAGITLRTTLEHESTNVDEYWYGGGVRRALVIGESLFTMSDSGLLRNRLDDMTQTGWTSF